MNRYLFTLLKSYSHAITMLTVCAALVAAIFTLVHPAPAGADCDLEEYVDTIFYGGHLDSHGEITLPMLTRPSERLEITIYLVADNEMYGAAVEWEILSETGLQLNWDCAAVYEPHTDNMYDRGDATPCANPAELRIASLIWGFTYSITIDIYDRIGWNQVGLSWGSASLVTDEDTFCGSINDPGHDCVPDHYFRVSLAPDDTLYVRGIFTASDRIGSAVTLRLYDKDYDEVALLLNVAAYGTVENDSQWVYTGEEIETFYMILRANPWDLWEYDLYFEIRGFQSPLTVEIQPDEEPVIIPPTGGSFGVTATVTNVTGDTVDFDGWIEIVLPSHGVLRPFIGPRNLSLDAYGIFSRHLNHTVPPGAPAGTYIYRGCTGIYPNEVWSFDEFPLFKEE